MEEDDALLKVMKILEENGLNALVDVSLKKAFIDVPKETQNRVFFERRYYLNASNTKWIAIGYRPIITRGDRVRFIRTSFIAGNAAPFFFDPCDFRELLGSMKKQSTIAKKLNVSDVAMNGPISQKFLVEQDSNTRYSDPVFTLKNTENKCVIKLGMNTIQNLLLHECVLEKILELATGQENDIGDQFYRAVDLLSCTTTHLTFDVMINFVNHCVDEILTKEFLLELSIHFFNFFKKYFEYVNSE